LGILAYGYGRSDADPEGLLMPYFTVLMIGWSTFFVEYWKQKQSTQSMKWGSKGFEDEEQDR
jgi:hypothetical protein